VVDCLEEKYWAQQDDGVVGQFGLEVAWTKGSLTGLPRSSDTGSLNMVPKRRMTAKAIMLAMYRLAGVAIERRVLRCFGRSQICVIQVLKNMKVMHIIAVML